MPLELGGAFQDETHFLVAVAAAVFTYFWHGRNLSAALGPFKRRARLRPLACLTS